MGRAATSAHHALLARAKRLPQQQRRRAHDPLLRAANKRNTNRLRPLCVARRRHRQQLRWQRPHNLGLRPPGKRRPRSKARALSRLGGRGTWGPCSESQRTRRRPARPACGGCLTTTRTSPICSEKGGLLVVVWGKDVERLATSVLAEMLLGVGNVRVEVATPDKNVLLHLLLLLLLLLLLAALVAGTATAAVAAVVSETTVPASPPRNVPLLVPRPLWPLIPVTRRGRAGASSKRSSRRRSWKLCWRNSDGWTPTG